MRTAAGSTLGLVLALVPVFAAGAQPAAAAADRTFTLHQRSRVETEKGSGRFHILTREARWDAARTAVIICDMWDKHWCSGATSRVAEMAPRMNEVVVAARRQGALIIHCPSNTMDFYKDTPQRRLAQAAPKVTPRVPLQPWGRRDEQREPPLPIDDSDGGCETAERSSRAWTRQIATIQIEPGDAITDSNEALALMQQRGIDHVVIMGVHTNMCVLGRPFGIRQLVKQGKNVVLVRDLTDTMYNPARRPFVSHFTGTDLVVEHIEKYWCPSVTSVDFLGGREFRFKEDRRPHLVFISAESEYFTERTLPEFALQQLGRHFRVSAVYADPKDYHTLPGLQVLKEADVVLFSLRRRPLVKEQMDLVRKCIAAGKGVAGVRTASHAFAKRAGEKLRPDVIEWPDFDREVLGCYYKGHHPNVLKPIVQAAPGAAEHPILTGIKAAKFTSAGSLYRSLPLAEDATLLMIGLAGELKPEPVAWCRRLREGSRVFCTSLGHQDDFREPIFQILLRNGILWAAGVPIPAADAPGN